MDQIGANFIRAVLQIERCVNRPYNVNVLLPFVLNYSVYFNSVPVEVYCEHEPCNVQVKIQACKDCIY